MIEALEESSDALAKHNVGIAQHNLALRQELQCYLQERGLSPLVSSSLVSNLNLLEVLLMSFGSLKVDDDGAIVAYG
jgi:hypothetical protein